MLKISATCKLVCCWGHRPKGTSAQENQGDYLSGKLGNVRDFDSCQGNLWDFSKSQGNVGNNLVREKWPKTVYCWLHICIHTCF